MNNSITRRLGLSRVDVAVAGVIVILASLLIWSIRTKSIARARTLEAANFLTEVHRCQNQYFEQHGHYAESLAALDLRLPPPTTFDLKPIVVEQNDWSLVAVKQGIGQKNPTRLSIDRRGWFQKNASTIHYAGEAGTLALASDTSIPN